MSLWDKIKDIMVIPEEDDYDVEADETPAPRATRERAEEPTPVKKESPARLIKSKTISYNQQGALQVVLVKPDRFDEVTTIADHLNDGKTVVLNLEESTKDTSRRIVDFLSGVAYANGGNMRKVAKNTFIIVARGVDVMGELLPEEFEDGKIYF
ncbi:MAG: cell division protein SepF [Clostridia bacterium]|nr:cell division protein SepF [Clostridia bacterium]